MKKSNKYAEKKINTLKFLKIGGDIEYIETPEESLTPALMDSLCNLNINNTWVIADLAMHNLLVNHYRLNNAGWYTAQCKRLPYDIIFYVTYKDKEIVINPVSIRDRNTRKWYTPNMRTQENLNEDIEIREYEDQLDLDKDDDINADSYITSYTIPDPNNNMRFKRYLAKSEDDNLINKNNNISLMPVLKDSTDVVETSLENYVNIYAYICGALLFNMDELQVYRRYVPIRNTQYCYINYITGTCVSTVFKGTNIDYFNYNYSNMYRSDSATPPRDIIKLSENIVNMLKYVRNYIPLRVILREVNNMSLVPNDSNYTGRSICKKVVSYACILGVVHSLKDGTLTSKYGEEYEDKLDKCVIKDFFECSVITSKVIENFAKSVCTMYGVDVESFENKEEDPGSIEFTSILMALGPAVQKAIGASMFLEMSSSKSKAKAAASLASRIVIDNFLANYLDTDGEDIQLPSKELLKKTTILSDEILWWRLGSYFNPETDVQCSQNYEDYLREIVESENDITTQYTLDGFGFFEYDDYKKEGES